MTTVLSFFFVIGGLVFVHELGHFLAARRLGVRVLKFSLGFGPRLWAVTHGGCEYCVRLVPLGGYVKMAGHDPDDPASDRNDSFLSRSKWERFQILAAGPAMNILLAILVMAVVVSQGVEVPVHADEPPVVAAALPDSAAGRAGIRPGDRVLTVAGRPVDTWRHLSREMLLRRPDRDAEITLLREGAPFVVTLRAGDDAHPPGQLGVLPVTDATRTVHPGPVEAVGLSVERNIEYGGLIVRVLGGLFTGETSMRQLQGPVAIAQAAGEHAEAGWIALLALLAVLSLNLGLLNLLPIPVLDGGHLLIMGLESSAGRDFSLAVKDTLHLAGLAVLMLLMVTVVYNDLVRLV